MNTLFQSTNFHLKRWKQGLYTYKCKTSNTDTDILFSDGIHSDIGNDNRVYDVMGNVAYSVNSSSRIVKELKSVSGVFCIDLSNFLHANLDVLAYKDCQDYKECKPVTQQILSRSAERLEKERVLSFVKTVVTPPPSNDE